MVLPTHRQRYLPDSTIISSGPEDGSQLQQGLQAVLVAVHVHSWKLRPDSSLLMFLPGKGGKIKQESAIYIILYYLPMSTPQFLLVFQWKNLVFFRKCEWCKVRCD